MPFGAVLGVAVTVAAVPVACRFFAAAFVFLFVIEVTCPNEKKYNVTLVDLVADDEGKKKRGRKG